MIGSVQLLEQTIRQMIVIPNGLENNLRFHTTGLGGVFIEYRSNANGGIASLNSNIQFTIRFITNDGAGRYIGDNIGVEMVNCIGIKPMRGVKKLLPYETVVGKVNIWLEVNRDFLISSIEY